MLLSKLKTFPGGSHIKDYKFLAEKSSIIDLPLPAKVRIPVNQHFGKSAQPIVQTGDSVKTGQLIAQAEGNFSSNIHSSISGKVIAVSKFPHPLGQESIAVEIESDGNDDVYGPKEKQLICWRI